MGGKEQQADTDGQDEVATGKVSSLERMLSILDLFTDRRPVWTVDAIRHATGYTSTTAYRYIKELLDSGLLAQIDTGKYSLGPRIIQLDRQISESEPLLLALQEIETELPRLDAVQNWHLCRLFKDQVICVRELGNLSQDLSYKRGFPMPLFRGATSTVILAWLPERQLMRLYLENEPAVKTPTLGQSWADYKKALRRIRQDGYAIAHAEVDPGVFAIAAPIFNPDGKVIGCISNVRRQAPQDKESLDADASIVKEVAQRLTDHVASILAQRELEEQSG